MKKNIDEDSVVNLYNIGYTTTDIAGIINNCSLSTINRILKRNGIQLRKKGESPNKNYKSNSRLKHVVKDVDKLKELFYNGIPINEIGKILMVSPKAVKRCIEENGLKRKKSIFSREQYDNENDEKIIKLYEEGKSTTEIGKIFGITHRTVCSHLKHCGVKIRKNSESHFIKNKKNFPDELKSYEFVYDMYIVRRISKIGMAKILNVSPNVIDRVLKEYNIKKRTISESKIGVFSREKHPNWKGGITSLYIRLREYFSLYQVKDVLKRDRYSCQLCGKKHKLQVHHIKPLKDIFNEIISEHPELDVSKDQDTFYNIIINDKRFINLDNLITYCKDCHLYKIHGYNKKIK